MLLYNISANLLPLTLPAPNQDPQADNQPEFKHVMPIFVDIDKKPYEEHNTGLPDIVKEIYAVANDGDSPLTTQRKKQEEEVEEALDAQEAQSKDNSGSSSSQKTSEK